MEQTYQVFWELQDGSQDSQEDFTLEDALMFLRNKTYELVTASTLKWIQIEVTPS